MANDRDAVLQKFSGLATTRGPTRRVDYKGLRRRMNLRLNREIAIGLQLIKLATGEDKNTFCERALGDAIAQRLTELEAAHDVTAWQTLIACASRERSA